MENKNLIYHYTSFEKLNLILKFGTLKFKESTKSNDILDTMGFVNILKNMTKFKAQVDMTDFLNFILILSRLRGKSGITRFMQKLILTMSTGI